MISKRHYYVQCHSVPWFLNRCVFSNRLNSETVTLS